MQVCNNTNNPLVNVKFFGAEWVPNGEFYHIFYNDKPVCLSTKDFEIQTMSLSMFKENYLQIDLQQETQNAVLYVNLKDNYKDHLLALPFKGFSQFEAFKKADTLSVIAAIYNEKAFVMIIHENKEKNNIFTVYIEKPYENIIKKNILKTTLNSIFAGEDWDIHGETTVTYKQNGNIYYINNEPTTQLQSKYFLSQNHIEVIDMTGGELYASLPTIKMRNSCIIFTREGTPIVPFPYKEGDLDKDKIFHHVLEINFHYVDDKLTITIKKEIGRTITLYVDPITCKGRQFCYAYQLENISAEIAQSLLKKIQRRYLHCEFFGPVYNNEGLVVICKKAGEQSFMCWAHSKIQKSCVMPYKLLISANNYTLQSRDGAITIESTIKGILLNNKPATALEPYLYEEILKIVAQDKCKKIREANPFCEFWLTLYNTRTIATIGKKAGNQIIIWADLHTENIHTTPYNISATSISNYTIQSTDGIVIVTSTIKGLFLNGKLAMLLEPYLLQEVFEEVVQSVWKNIQEANPLYEFWLIAYNNEGSFAYGSKETGETFIVWIPLQSTTIYIKPCLLTFSTNSCTFQSTDQTVRFEKAKEGIFFNGLPTTILKNCTLEKIFEQQAQNRFRRMREEEPLFFKALAEILFE